MLCFKYSTPASSFYLKLDATDNTTPATPEELALWWCWWRSEWLPGRQQKQEQQQKRTSSCVFNTPFFCV